MAVTFVFGKAEVGIKKGAMTSDGMVFIPRVMEI
jgi:hypothetical protein